MRKALPQSYVSSLSLTLFSLHISPWHHLLLSRPIKGAQKNQARSSITWTISRGLFQQVNPTNARNISRPLSMARLCLVIISMRYLPYFVYSLSCECLSSPNSPTSSSLSISSEVSYKTVSKLLVQALKSPKRIMSPSLENSHISSSSIEKGDCPLSSA